MRLHVILAATTALAGCAAGPTTTTGSTADAPVVAAATAVPKASIGEYGFDSAGMSTSVAPGDDFYKYANGTYLANTPIPADKSSFGMFEQLQDLSDQRTKDILQAESAAGTSKVGIAYKTFLDTAAIEAKGMAPIQPWLAQIRAAKTRDAYVALLAEAKKNGVSQPLGIGVSPDAKDPNSYTVSVRQAGLGMPDRDYYLSSDAKLAEARAAYGTHLANMLTLAGEANAAARAKAVLDFETAIAKASWTRTESRDADKTYNKMSVAELEKMAPGFPFGRFLAATGLTTDTVVVAQPSAVKAIAALLAKTPVQVLDDQLTVRSLGAFASVLPAAVDQENFRFNSTILSGVPQQRDRWKRAVDFTNGVLTDDVSKLYVAKYFPPEAKAAADEMVGNIIAAMGKRIDALAWMAPETKVKAKAKLAAFTPRIGYPSQWNDYGALDIKAGDAFGNALRANRWAYDYNRNKLGKPVYRWEWGMTPMTVNAQANPTLVAITFPAAILQPPFFDPHADAAVNYGGIGAVIGHEMSHHFDDQGSKFDTEGRLTQWWTDADIAAFKARSKQLADQFSAYEPLPGKHVNGELTLGENSADLAGLSAAYDAYLASLGGKAPPVIDGTTGAERFYLGWAQVWRRNYREANLMQRLLTDPHAPSEYRADIVRNMDPWNEAFKPQPSQKLYLAPEARVRIW